MLAITLKQPWAHLIFNDDKDCENRTWKPPKHCINTWIALHAGKSYDKDCLLKITRKDLVFGSIIGFVKFSDCVTDHPSKWAIQGQYHWVIAEKKTLELPIPCKGYQGFWRFDQGEILNVRDRTPSPSIPTNHT
jgi:hypothetical protein